MVSELTPPRNTTSADTKEVGAIYRSSLASSCQQVQIHSKNSQVLYVTPACRRCMSVWWYSSTKEPKNLWILFNLAAFPHNTRQLCTLTFCTFYECMNTINTISAANLPWDKNAPGHIDEMVLYFLKLQASNTFNTGNTYLTLLLCSGLGATKDTFLKRNRATMQAYKFLWVQLYHISVVTSGLGKGDKRTTSSVKQFSCHECVAGPSPVWKAYCSPESEDYCVQEKEPINQFGLTTAFHSLPFSSINNERNISM